MVEETQNVVAETLGIDVENEIDWGDSNPEQDNFQVLSDEEYDNPVEEETEEEVEETESESEESDETTVEDEESDEVEETTEESEEADDVVDDEAVTQLKEVNTNLNKAMLAERTKRKEFGERVTALESQLEAANAVAKDGTYDELVAQIKRLGLDDVLDIKEVPQIDPRVQQMLDEQENQRKQIARENSMKAFHADMQEDVKLKVGNYTNIDSKDLKQGEALGNLILAGVAQGGSLEDVVDSSLKTLDSLLAVKTSKRKAPVTPKNKPKAASKSTATATQRTSAKKVAKGDFSDVFERAVSSFEGLS